MLGLRLTRELCIFWLVNSLSLALTNTDQEIGEADPTLVCQRRLINQRCTRVDCFGCRSKTSVKRRLVRKSYSWAVDRFQRRKHRGFVCEAVGSNEFERSIVLLRSLNTVEPQSRVVSASKVIVQARG